MVTKKKKQNNNKRKIIIVIVSIVLLSVIGYCSYHLYEANGEKLIVNNIKYSEFNKLMDNMKIKYSSYNLYRVDGVDIQKYQRTGWIVNDVERKTYLYSVKAFKNAFADQNRMILKQGKYPENDKEILLPIELGKKFYNNCVDNSFGYDCNNLYSIGDEFKLSVLKDYNGCENDTTKVERTFKIVGFYSTYCFDKFIKEEPNMKMSYEGFEVYTLLDEKTLKGNDNIYVIFDIKNTENLKVTNTISYNITKLNEVFYNPNITDNKCKVNIKTFNVKTEKTNC